MFLGRPTVVTVAFVVVVGISATVGLAMALTQVGRLIPSPVPVPIAYEAYSSGAWTQLPRGSWVIQDQEAWADLRARHGASEGGPPAVDLASQTLVVVAMGEKPTGGYEISVTSIYRIGSHVFVQILEVSPGPSCVVTQGLTNPYVMVLMPKTAEGFTFTTHPEVRAC